MPKRMILIAVLFLLCYCGWQSADFASDVDAEALLVDTKAASQDELSPPPTTTLPAELEAAEPATTKADTATQAAALLQQAIIKRQCWNVPVDASALEAWLQQATHGHEVPEQIFGMRQRFTECQQHFAAQKRQSTDPMASSTPQQQPEHYLALLLQAATLGSDDAVQQLWTLSEPELVQQLQLTSLPRDKKIKLKQEFKQQQYQLAAAVAQAGGEQAALLLISGYQQYDPATGGQSYDKALAYVDFMLETSRNNDIYAQLQWQRDKLLTRMTEDEIGRAQHLTAQLLQPQYQMQSLRL